MRRPRRRDGMLWRVRWPLSAIALVFVVGFAGYLVLDFAPVDALTNTVLVLTTVGFSAPHPLSSVTKIFTDVIAILGVSAYLAMLAVLAGALAEGHFGTVSRRRRQERRAERLRDHFIVCAYGRVGRAVAADLAAAGEPFIVIDRREDLEPSMRADGVTYLIGDPASEEVLERAGLARARALVSAVDNDADSVFITLTARALNPDVFIVARGGQVAAASRLYRAGAHRVVSPYVSSGRHMARLAQRPLVADYLEVRAADGTVMRLEEILVGPGSEQQGKTVAEVCGAATPLVIRREDGSLAHAPAPGEVLGANDLVVVLGEPDAPPPTRGRARRSG